MTFMSAKSVHTVIDICIRVYRSAIYLVYILKPLPKTYEPTPKLKIPDALMQPIHADPAIYQPKQCHHVRVSLAPTRLYDQVLIRIPIRSPRSRRLIRFIIVNYPHH